MTELLTIIKVAQNKLYQQTPKDERLHWSGLGTLDFFVSQNNKDPDVFEVEVLDHSGCMGGLEETYGLASAIEDGLLGIDLVDLKQGFTYHMIDISVECTRGDGWEIDDDMEYYGGPMTRSYKLWPLIKHTIHMFWWQNFGWKLREKKNGK